ncbi:MAG: hypothetical protein DRP38_05955 [Thermotogae bacterium]|nr:MAG: hypothetical protein DRP38_05955 [Thermotogota bacterium]
MNKFLIFIFVLVTINSFPIITLNLHMMSDEQATDVLLDVKNKIEQLAPDYTEIIFDSATPASYDLFFFIEYNASLEAYIGEWKEDSKIVSRCEYDPKGYKFYKDFIMECASCPLEKASFKKFSMGDFSSPFRLTYHPALDEYPDFSPDGKYICFISDRIGGNRNIFLIDKETGKLIPKPVYGSSEYFPKFSPSGNKMVFQGSLHGNWNIYTMPLENYSRSIRRISSGRAPAYSPNWLDEDKVIYVQDHATSNYFVVADTRTLKRKVIELPFDRIFSPTPHGSDLYFVGLKEADFGIYKLTPDGSIITVEDTEYNEHDPCIKGDFLVFTSNRDGIYRLWAKDMKTGKVWCLTEDIPYDTFYPVFSPDGSLIAFSVYKTGSEPDIWIIRFNPSEESSPLNDLP